MVIRLQDHIRIKTTPERIFDWLASLPQEYRSWHPDHVACRVVGGSLLTVGSEIEFQEILHGKLHRMRLRPTRVEPGRRLEYQLIGMGRGAFEIVPQGEEIEFIARLDLGTDAPLIGRLVDAVLRAFFSRRLEALRQHMVAEGVNLQAILESGWQPGALAQPAAGPA